MKALLSASYILAFFLMMPFVVHAQTLVPKETANKYFENCVAQPPAQQFTADSQNMFCACTAARLAQFFTLEDMKTMTDTTAAPAAQRGAFNKMLINIYAPCMETPAREFHFNACISNPDTAKYGDPNKICPCMADAIGLHMKHNGPNVFQELLARDPNLTDPMSALTDDPSFKTFAQSKLLACLR